MRPKAETHPTPALGPEDFNATAVPDGDAALPLHMNPDKNLRSMPRFEIEWELGSNEPMIGVRKIAEALRLSTGNVAEAARILSEATSSRVSRSYVAKRISSEPLLEELQSELKETVLDFAEENIRLKVQLGDAEASKFLLRTIGRSRGYVEPRKEGPEGPVADATATEKLQAMEEGRKRAREARQKLETGGKVINLKVVEQKKET